VSISVVAASFALGLADALLAGGTEAGTVFYVLGTSGLGVALSLIHIYVNELKRLLQVFWLAGALGATYILVSHSDVPLPAYVFEHPTALWITGPVFAALTGLTFKEGVCYGKLEAFALTVLVPVWLLGHLTTLAPQWMETGLAVGIAGLLGVFAARKYTQPVKDDIGDGSVFKFQKMPPEEQALFLKRLREEGEIWK